MTHFTTYCDRDNIYLNLVFQNNSSNPNSETIAEYNFTNHIKPIIDRPCDFYMSVISFDIPLNGIPPIYYAYHSKSR